MKYTCIFLFVCIGLMSCNYVSKTAAKKGYKPIRKEVTKISSKYFGKKSVKLAVKDLPKGRKTLAVVKEKNGRIVPAINNLNENSALYISAVNKVLLVRRRAAISPFDQFPTMTQLKSYDPRKLILKETPSADILRKNMYLAMDKNSVLINKGFGGTAAHHVIEGADKSAVQSRAILKKYGININAPENGILLPDGENSIYKGSRHITSHTEEYSKYVYSKIKDAKSKDDLIASLLDIKHELYTGKLNLQGPAQIINKNIH